MRFANGITFSKRHALPCVHVKVDTGEWDGIIVVTLLQTSIMLAHRIATQEEALTHLFFHCCFRDGTFTEGEVKVVSEKLVAVGLNKTLNFRDEVVKYKTYRSETADEQAYIETLLSLIRPTNELALYSYCIELCLSDGLLQPEEERLLDVIATALPLEPNEAVVCKKLMVQRKVVDTQKLF